MRKKRREPDDVAPLIRVLEDRGYRVNRPVDYVKKTFDIDVARLESVNKVRLANDLTLREVFMEALDLWLAKYKNE
jgi:hypothetical protein